VLGVGRKPFLHVTTRKAHTTACCSQGMELFFFSEMKDCFPFSR
jgi:hypothetical protein